MLKKKLLLTGMGCFLCYGALTFLNVTLLPYARACYGYGAPLMLLSLGLSLGLYALACRRLARMDDGRLARILRIAQPCFICALLLLQILLGYMMQYTPSGDNFMLYNGSMTLADDGCLDANPDFGLYLARFSNQWGFLLILSLLRRLFMLLGIDGFFMPLVVVQAALYALAVAVLAATADLLGGVRARARALMLLAACLPLYLAAGVLYTDTFSAPFAVFTLYFALRALRAQSLRGRLLFALCAGGAAFLGAQIKMTVLIVLIAAVLVWLLSLRPAQAIACALLSAAVALGGTAAVHAYMLENVIDPEVYAQHNTPAIHWFMMSIPTGNNPYGGMYSGDYALTWGMMEEGAPRGEVMATIYTRIKDRIYTLRYPDRLLTAMLRKNACTMGDGTFAMTEMLDDRPVRPNALSGVVLEAGAYYSLYSAVCSGMFMANLLLALLGCLRAIRAGDTRAAAGYVAMFGMMLFLMLWEARGRYVFCFVPVLLLLASLYAPQGREKASAPRA